MTESQLESLIQRALAGERTAISEALSLVEDSRPQAEPNQRTLLKALENQTTESHTTVGLTGPPGAGKSTLASALIQHWRNQDETVGMVAVDPTSRRSGGALLGDRARMQLGTDDGVFVRSMASRDQLGGLAPAARGSALVLRAMFDWVLVETVGVGQSEVDIETVADSIVLVLQPGSGDTLQFMKAGILEIPDVLVVHKWDLGLVAERTRADLESILNIRGHAQRSWPAPVIGVSSQTGEGVPELVEQLRAHRRYLEESGELEKRRAESRAAWSLELFTRRYGALGLERVGGLQAARECVEKTRGTALDCFTELANRAGLDE